MTTWDLKQRIIRLEKQAYTALAALKTLRADLCMVEASLRPATYRISMLLPLQIIEHVLKGQDEPITFRRLKDLIQEEGYPVSRFGHSWRYFYIILGRLHARKIICRDGGKVFLSPKEEGSYKRM